MLSGQGQHEAMMRGLALDRRKQINTLLIFNENVSEVSPNLRYRVDFTAGSDALVMIIDLPPKFPAPGSQNRPVIRIESSQGSGYGLRHSWLDGRGNVIGAPGLNAYGTHSELGRVVQAIKRAFEKDPPVVYGGHQPNNSHSVSTATGAAPYGTSSTTVPPSSQTNPAMYPYSSATSGLSSSQTNPAMYTQNVQSSHLSSASGRAFQPTPAYPYANTYQQPMAHPSSQPNLSVANVPQQHPPLPHRQSNPHSSSQSQVLSELEGLSTAELEELKSDEIATRAFLKSVANPDMDALDKVISDSREAVSKRVEENRQLVQAVSDKKTELEGLRSCQANLCDKVKELEAKVQMARERNTLASIGGALKTQCTKEEESSEECAEDYLSGKLTTDEFLSEYVKLRSRHHQTKAKLEDVVQTNRQLQQFGGGSGGGPQQQHWKS